MSFIHASIQGLQGLATLSTLFGLLGGMAWGLLISFMPGVGGNVALALLLPVIYRFPLPVALALLFGTHIATYFGGSITSITLNIPASTKSLPLCWDGYPLASQGRGAYALRASATAAGIGGVIGAIVLTLGIPVMRGMLNYLGPPEILLLAVLGTILIAILSSGNLTKGLIAFGVGIILAWVGQDPITGVARLTFGSLYLSSGIQLADIAIGLFAVVQVMRLLTGQGGVRATAGSGEAARAAQARGTREPQRQRGRGRRRGADADSPLDGFWAVIRHWKLELYMAVFGVFTGTVPGFGAPVAAVAAYGQAAQFSKSDVEFGSGAIEGVIAPEATDSAAEGGGMLPLLSLGIPTHEQQAILLAAFVTIGIAPGPTMLSNHLPTVFSIVWIIVIASLATMLLGLLLAKQFAKLSTIPVSLLVPLIMMISIIGSFAVNGTIDDAITTVVAGVIGYFFWKYNYSRINLIIGLVLGPIIESNLHIATTLYGNGFVFTRPLSAIVAVAIVATIAAWGWQNVRDLRAARLTGQPGSGRNGQPGTRWNRLPSLTEIAGHARTGQMVTAVLILGAFLAVAVISRGYGALTGGDLGLVAMIGAALAVLNVARLLRFGADHEEGAGERLRRSRSAKRVTSPPVAVAAAAPAGDVAVIAPAAPSALLGSGDGDGAHGAGEASGAGDASGAGAAGDDAGTDRSAGPASGSSRDVVSARATIRSVAIVASFLVLTLLLGIIPASGLSLGIYTKFIARKPVWYAAVASVATWLVTWALFHYVVNEYIVYGGIWNLHL